MIYIEKAKQKIMFSMPGKINHVNKAKLTIHLNTGHMIDFKECVESNQACVVKITLNDLVLYHNTVDQLVQIEHSGSPKGGVARGPAEVGPGHPDKRHQPRE